MPRPTAASPARSSTVREVIAMVRDDGEGFAVEEAEWSPLTEEALLALDALGASCSVVSGPSGTRWRIEWRRR
ncbi:MAG: hypothetical protein ACYDH5_16400 [Acidimicrobiales bacterium]